MVTVNYALAKLALFCTIGPRRPAGGPPAFAYSPVIARNVATKQSRRRIGFVFPAAWSVKFSHNPFPGRSLPKTEPSPDWLCFARFFRRPRAPPAGHGNDGMLEHWNIGTRRLAKTCGSLVIEDSPCGRPLAMRDPVVTPLKLLRKYHTSPPVRRQPNSSRLPTIICLPQRPQSTQRKWNRRSDKRERSAARTQMNADGGRRRGSPDGISGHGLTRIYPARPPAGTKAFFNHQAHECGLLGVSPPFV
jgi:hypothetical protein